MNTSILIYDDNCPLCTWYSGLFIKFGLLPGEGRKAFSTLEPSILEKIDFTRGRNEIPLLDPISGRVLYGIDALLEILGQKFPFLKKIGNTGPLNWFFRRLYRLISFNRKVIIAKKCSNGLIDCAPDFNYFYRVLLMAVFLVFNTVMLIPLHYSVFLKLSYYNLDLTSLQAAHLSLVFLNCLLACFFKKEKAIEYLGQVNMLATMVILFLIPLLIIEILFPPGEMFVTIYLAAAAIIIFKEYLRRMDYAGVLQKNNWIAGINMAGLTGFLLFVFN